MRDPCEAPLHIPESLAPGYLGMSGEAFDILARPSLVDYPNGRGGRFYRRRDLDAWADSYKRQHGRQRTG